MRLIDADAIIARADTIRKNTGNMSSDVARTYLMAGINTIIKIIEDAPTVDAVDVVRCKNCRWYDKVDWCNKLRISGVKAFEETWFCAEGEEDAVD